MVLHGSARTWHVVCLTVLSLTALRQSGAAHDESFSEELLVRPLPDGKVLAHFHFVSKLEKGADRHHRIFPKAVDQLVRKFSLHELELSFTQGRWDYSRWGAAEGIAPIAAKPAGVELWAHLAVESEAEADATWRNLTHTLSGIFCSSVNALADPASKVAPAFSFRPDLAEARTSDHESSLEECTNLLGGSTERSGAEGRCARGKHVTAAEACKNPGGEATVYPQGVKVSIREGAGECLLSLDSHGFEQPTLDGPHKEWGAGELGAGSVRYGALPREAVCTENLTPWLKLLPCRDRAGLASLLERRRVYGGAYHSLRVHIRAGGSARTEGVLQAGSGSASGTADTTCGEKGTSGGGDDVSDREDDVSGGREGSGGIVLEQTLTLVLDGGWGGIPQKGATGGFGAPRELSVSGVFGRQLAESCPLAATSRLYLEVDRTGVPGTASRPGRTTGSATYLQKDGPGKESLRHEEERDGGLVDAERGAEAGEQSSDAFGRDSADDGEKSGGGPSMAYSRGLADGEKRESVGAGFSKGLLGVTVTPEPTQVWSADSGSKQLLDYDLKRAPLRQPLDVSFRQNGSHRWVAKQAPFAVSRFVTGHGMERGGIRLELTRVPTGPPGGDTDVRFFQLLPWFIRVYFHTLRLEMDGRHVALSDWTREVSLVPAVDRERQAVMELRLRIPAAVGRVVLSMDFDKGYLRIEEHPPDGDRGFDLPSAVLTFSSVPGGMVYRPSERSVGDEARDLRVIEGRPLLLRMQENLTVRVYTRGLLIPLATPDFSMPYNVITLTSTVIAMIFSSLFNALLQKGQGAEAEPGGNISPVTLARQELAVEKQFAGRKFKSRLWSSYARVWDVWPERRCNGLNSGIDSFGPCS